MDFKTTGAVGLVMTATFIAGCGSNADPETYWAQMTPRNYRTPAASVRPRSNDTPTPFLSENPTLQDYLAYAAMNNPALAAAYHHWQAAEQQAPQAGALPDPQLTYRYYIREVETRVGPQRQAIGLAQTLPWFGKRDLRSQVAKSQADIARRRYETAKLTLFHQVRDAYGEYYYLGRATAIAAHNVQLLSNIESVARSRYKTAAAGHSDVIRAQVELGKAQDNLRSLSDLRGALMARLNAALNRRASGVLPWPKTVPTEQLALSDDELLKLMNQSHPELGALDSEIEKHKQLTDLARKNYYPDVKLAIEYIDTDRARGGMNPADNGKDPLMATVSVNVPIWWDKLRAGVSQARHNRMAAIMTRAQKANALTAQLKLAAYHYRDARRKASLYRDTILPRARQSLKTSESAFRTGKGSFNDLIDAQRVLLSFELSYERAIAGGFQRLSELEMLVGVEIPRSQAERSKP